MNTHEPEWVALVREKVETLRFGVVQIVIHDSKVTRIERTEKTRLVSCESEFISNDQTHWREPKQLERHTGPPENVPHEHGSFI